MIELNNIVKSYGDKEVIKGLNLKIEDGKVYGLVGPNGAGKSTLLNIMNGAYKTDNGEVLYDGINVYENVDLKKDILLISDDPYYFSNATIESMKDFYKVYYPELNEELFNQYISLFKLPKNKMIKTFSKGMKRQTFLCIALAVSPKYLFLDEAFDGLDPVMRLSFKRAITKAIDEEQMTIIISSHNLRELEDICDNYCILNDGIVLDSGNIFDSKEMIHKVQVVFKEVPDDSIFEGLDIINISRSSKITTLIVKGNEDEIREYFDAFNPLLIEILPVSLEEIFIYEMERKGYGIYEINE